MDKKINSTSNQGAFTKMFVYSDRNLQERFKIVVIPMLFLVLSIFVGPILGKAECAENTLTQEDIKFLNMAIGLASQAVKAGNHPFGAVVVKDGKLLAQGMNEVVTKKEEFLHAEIVALNAAYQKLGRKGVEGATLYTSCEPCPMCSGAVYISGISRVVYAISCKKFGAIIGDDSFCMSARQVLELGERQTIVQGPFMEDIAAGPVYKYIDKVKKDKDVTN